MNSEIFWHGFKVFTGIYRRIWAAIKPILCSAFYWKPLLLSWALMIPVILVGHALIPGWNHWYGFFVGAVFGWYAGDLYRLSQRFINW